MANKHIEAVAIKAIRDAKFRKLIEQDPAAVLKQLGIRADKRKIAALKALPHGNLKKLAKAFGHKSRLPFN